MTMDRTASYAERTLALIYEQCSRRGIPPEEVDSFLAHVEKERGRSVLKMHDGELRNMVREIDYLFESYLEGVKRRGDAAGGVKASDAARKLAAMHRIPLSKVKATGSKGGVTKADVEKHIG